MSVPASGIHKLFEEGKKPNLLFIITDQERAIQHWPHDFVSKYLPSRQRLEKHGLSFERFYCNACMCSPSRATLLTSQFPAVTGVCTTGSPEPQVHLPTGIHNLATLLAAKDYHCEWHGKWHLGGHPSEYGFQGWHPPDAGNYLSLNDTLGGGDPNNDGRFLEEVLNFLQNYKKEQPFCLVVSLVNPHDVYVAQYDPALGYTKDDFKRLPDLPLPTNYQEDLGSGNKPRAQDCFSYQNVTFDNTPQDYINFYAYLHTVVDDHISKVLDALDDAGWTESTLILRTADHGEQALSHGLVEKFFNVYEESIRIPLVVSNPVAFPARQTTQALASHVDLIPTLLELLDDVAPFSLRESKRKPYKPSGTSLCPIFENTQQTKLQRGLHFTYDDIPSRTGPATIRCWITQRYKYAVYFEPKSGKDADWELYDLQTDPLENTNLAGKPSYATLQASLDNEVVRATERCGTLPTNFSWPPTASKYSVGAKYKS